MKNLSNFGSALAAATVLVVCSTGLVACSTGEDVKQVKADEARKVPAEMLFAGQMCPIQAAQPEIHWVKNTEEWRRWQSDKPRQVISLDDTPARETRSQVDFGQQRVIVVGLGQKPTGGYAVSLRDPGVQLKEGVLQVHVDVQEPPADAMVMQVLTSPCLALQVPLLDAMTLQAVDQQGRVLAQEQLTPP